MTKLDDKERELTKAGQHIDQQPQPDVLERVRTAVLAKCWRCGNPMLPERPACPNSEIGAPCMSEGPPVPPKHRPVASERGYLGSTVDGGIDDHDCGEDTDVESSEPR